MRSDIACSSNDDDAKLFRRSVSEFGVAKSEGRKKSDDLLSMKPLLSVPSIYVDNVDSDSTKSFLIDSPALSETDWTGLDLNSIDVDTISMIVRNVEAFDKTKRDSDDVYNELIEVELPEENQVVGPSEQKGGSLKKHDFIHNLQEKLHHLSDTLHRKESPPRQHAKPGEMLHGLKENMSGKFHQIAEKMHHFHLPHLPLHQQTVSENGLVGQAMQTILMEKFNIVEASSTGNSVEVSQKRKSSSSSLQSIKQKFNLFQRPRRSIDSETSSLRSISEVKALESSEKIWNDAMEIEEHDLPEKLDDESSLLELKVHDEHESGASNESLITVVSNDKKAISKEDLRVSVEHFDSILSAHKTFTEPTTFADTNKIPLHASLLSLSRNEQLSTSPSVKMHARTESIGCKFPASPSKLISGSVGKDSTLTAVHRRSSDSDLSVTPKGEQTTGNLSSCRNYFHSFSETFF